MGPRHILYTTAVMAALASGCAKGGTSLDSDAMGVAGTEAKGFCGNGVLDRGESCDGDELNGETCKALGHGGGMLTCDPATCTYDTQMCTPAKQEGDLTDSAGNSG